MDPITALGVASAVIQLVKFGAEVARKLSDYSAAANDVPRPLQSINTRLPLLINSLSRIQNESEVSSFDADIRSVLHGVVVGCMKLVRELDEIADKIRPKPGESFATKLKKVLKSLKIEERIEDIDTGLQGYISVLILHRVVDRTVAQALPSEEVNYFGVIEKRAEDWISREALLIRLDQCFFEAARGQKQVPEYVVLQGNEGNGKSQLALAYCHQAYDLGQFQTVFWLDASTPTSLLASLESAASSIRRTKAGTGEEKRKFLDNFLTERWHPWLLVLDNYQYKEFHNQSIGQLLPQKGNGGILVTTRDYDMPPLGIVVKVNKVMTPMEETEMRLSVTKALHSKNLETIKEALDQGMKVDSVSHSVWGKDGEPMVNVAAEGAFNAALALFLDLGANAHLIPSMHSVLASAVRSGNLSTVTLYLDHEDRTSKPLSADNYDWAFRVALEQGDIPIFREIYTRREHHFNADARNTSEGIANAAERGNIDILRELTSLGKFTTVNWKRANALCKAVCKLDFEITEFLLTEAHVDPNDINDSGETALYHATAIGRYNGDAKMRDEFISLLLAAGASPNSKMRGSQRTPLHQAASYGYTSSLKLLLEKDADVTIVTERGMTPLMLAIDWKAPTAYEPLANVEISDPEKRKNYFSKPMFMAAENGDRDLALLLLKKDIIDIVNPETGDTALITAIRHNQVPMARMLIRNRARQDIADKEGKVAMILAAEKGLELVLRDLSKAADSPGLEVCDKKENTPLILAAQGDHQKAVKVLLDLGADRDAMNVFGETAMDVVEEKELKEIIKLLQEGL